RAVVGAVGGALVRGEPGVADTGDGQPGHLLHRVLQHDSVALLGDGGGGQRGVVVAADVDVRDVEGTDGVHERGLHRGTPVVDVAGVDDQVDLVLLHDRLDERPRGRVEVQVGDVQRADGTGVRLVHR